MPALVVANNVGDLKAAIEAKNCGAEMTTRVHGINKDYFQHATLKETFQKITFPSYYSFFEQSFPQMSLKLIETLCAQIRRTQLSD